MYTYIIYILSLSHRSLQVGTLPPISRIFARASVSRLRFATPRSQLHASTTGSGGIKTAPGSCGVANKELAATHGTQVRECSCCS